MLQAGAWRRAVLLPALAALIVTGVATPAAAETTGLGHDISHPQCDAPLPDGSAFGIVGINQGRPFSANPCLAGQYRWATESGSSAAVYINTGNPAPTSDYYWPKAGSEDPALSKDPGSTIDTGCAYDYGWHAAADALATGRRLGDGALAHTWWLDVETTNTWNGDNAANTAVLQGMYDHLRSNGVAQVGLYSTGYQWKQITGGYTAKSANPYYEAWQPHFTPKFALHEAPLWIATAATSGAARKRCSTSFTGAAATMVQFRGDDGFDTNLIC